MGKKIPRSDVRRKIILATNCEHTSRMQLGKGLCQLEEADEARREASLDRAAAPDAVPVHALAMRAPAPAPERALSAPGRVRPMEQLDVETSAVLRAWPSAAAAEQGTGINAGTISRVARGLNRSAGGYGWRFVGDDAEPRAGTTAPVAAGERAGGSDSGGGGGGRLVRHVQLSGLRY